VIFLVGSIYTCQAETLEVITCIPTSGSIVFKYGPDVCVRKPAQRGDLEANSISIIHLQPINDFFGQACVRFQGALNCQLNKLRVVYNSFGIEFSNMGLQKDTILIDRNMTSFQENIEQVDMSINYAGFCRVDRPRY
jgi:hypothetical protein